MHKEDIHKIKQFLLGKQPENLRIGLQLIRNASPAESLPFIAQLFAVSYFQPDKTIQNEAQNLLLANVSEQLCNYLNENQHQLSGLSRYAQVSLENELKQLLPPLKKYTPEHLTETANLALHWLGSGFVFCYQHQIPVWETHTQNYHALSLNYRSYATGMAVLLPKFKSLTRLSLSHNHLRDLPEEIGQLPQLQHLDLSNNSLKDIDVLTSLHTLQTLDVAQNRLQYLPEDMGKLNLLNDLNIAHNQLSSLPQSFTSLHKLEILHCENNQIENLPENLERFTSLKQWNIFQNKLSLLPASFGRLHALEEFNINNNVLIRLPENLEQLTHLKTLWLYGNQLETLPESIKKLPQLTEIYIGHNRMTLPPECLTSLKVNNNIWQDSMNWEIGLISTAEACFMNDGGYHDIDGQVYWNETEAIQFLEEEYVREELYYESQSYFFDEVKQALSSQDLIADDINCLLDRFYWDSSGSPDLFFPISYFQPTIFTLDFESNDPYDISYGSPIYSILPMPPYDRRADREARLQIQLPQEIETLTNLDFHEQQEVKFLTQQTHYIDINLLPYFSDDDMADLLYQQVKMNPWLWALLSEGLYINYFVEGQSMAYEW